MRGNAHRDRGVAVVPHRAHPGADLGVLQEQEEADQRRDREQRGKDAVDIVVDAKERKVPVIGGRMRRGVGPKTMRTLSCRISDRPNVATIDSAAAPRTGWMTTRWISAPRRNPISGATIKPSQKLPVASSVNQASTVPTMKKSPCAILMTSSRPKMIGKAERDQGDDQPPDQPVQGEQQEACPS